MKLEKIITLASSPVRLRFLAMERSLRATGCELPLWVIPYDDNRFELPPNAKWWTLDSVRQWLQAESSHTIMSKYQCLLESNYQFVDSDIVFLRNPEEVLAPTEGFIASCCHWRSPGHTVTEESKAILKARSTVWQRAVFNSGQFACDRALFTFEELKRLCLDPKHENTCLRLPYEQPAVVLLANLSGVAIHNLTLPPTCMESTWAGDYTTENFREYWHDESRKPYLIHWAGCNYWVERPVDSLFTDYFTAAELAEWKQKADERARHEGQASNSIRHQVRQTVRIIKSAMGKKR